jgi:UDP-N-acetylmuramoyl-tripeptide--D-alanyl-D-alanine ligase
MLSVSTDTIVRVTGGELVCGDAETFSSGVAIDSRCVESGNVFVALPGEHTDGHDYLSAALAAGARVLIVTREGHELGTALESAARRRVSVVRVADSCAAIQQLAAYHRGRLLCPIIGITGSTGKTTTKDLVAAVLSAKMRVASTVGNRNNELGVPLTLLGADTDVDAVVVEMGMRGSGQIAALCDIARPTMGLVTNVGTNHIELLGTTDAVADAKGELVEAIPADGAVFLNGDDDYTARLARRAEAPVISYGLSDTCVVRAVDVEVDSEGAASFTLVAPQGEARVALGVLGRHNVYNALAAAAVGLRLALSVADVVKGLESARTTSMRMESISTAAGVTIINDAYNASPSSMKAAVDALAQMSPTGKRVAVLGDMAELGSLTELAHFQIGEQVARSGIDYLVTVGDRAQRIAEGAIAEGMDGGSVAITRSNDEALGVLDGRLCSGDIVLVKASRVMGLEAVVEGIVTPDVR